MLANENKRDNFSLDTLASNAYDLPVRRKTYKTADVLEMLKRKQGDKSMRKFAIELGISAPYLWDIYKGQRLPGPAVLEKLGLARKNIPTEHVYEVVA